MKLLIDMNLSPDWVQFLAGAGVESIHWSKVGAPYAPDSEIIAHASANGYVILTQDLDFGIILAATRVGKPSVVQIRSADLDPNVIGKHILTALSEGNAELQSGALLSIDSKRIRLRVLPFPSP